MIRTQKNLILYFLWQSFLKEKEKPGKVKEIEIAYPKIGEAYDPKAINSWSNMRGFQNVAAQVCLFLCLILKTRII